MNLCNRSGGFCLLLWEAESLRGRPLVFVLRVMKERALLCATAVVRVKRTWHGVLAFSWAVMSAARLTCCDLGVVGGVGVLPLGLAFGGLFGALDLGPGAA